MVKTFATNENNDIYIGKDGNIVVATGIQAILNICANVAKAQKGEMLFSVDQGIPNFETLWGGQPNIAQFEAALRNALLAVPGVTGIKNLESGVSNETLYYAVTIQTIYGEGVLNG